MLSTTLNTLLKSKSSHGINVKGGKIRLKWRNIDMFYQRRKNKIMLKIIYIHLYLQIKEKTYTSESLPFSIHFRYLMLCSIAMCSECLNRYICTLTWSTCKFHSTMALMSFLVFLHTEAITTFTAFKLFLCMNFQKMLSMKLKNMQMYEIKQPSKTNIISLHIYPQMMDKSSHHKLSYK